MHFQQVHTCRKPSGPQRHAGKGLLATFRIHHSTASLRLSNTQHSKWDNMEGNEDIFQGETMQTGPVRQQLIPGFCSVTTRQSGKRVNLFQNIKSRLTISPSVFTVFSLFGLLKTVRHRKLLLSWQEDVKTGICWVCSNTLTRRRALAAKPEAAWETA